MARSTSLTLSFSYGEISPEIRKRIDLASYTKSCEIFKNFIPLKQGPAIFRNGSRFLKSVPGQIGLVREFSTGTTGHYLLVFRQNHLEILSRDGMVQQLGNQFSVSRIEAAARVIREGGGSRFISWSIDFYVENHGLSVGDDVLINGVTNLSDGTYRVESVGSNYFVIYGGVSQDDVPALSSESSVRISKESFEVQGLDTQEDLDGIQFAQDENKLYFSLKNGVVYSLDSEGGWSLSELENAESYKVTGLQITNGVTRIRVSLSFGSGNPYNTGDTISFTGFKNVRSGQYPRIRDSWNLNTKFKVLAKGNTWVEIPTPPYSEVVGGLPTYANAKASGSSAVPSTQGVGIYQNRLVLFSGETLYFSKTGQFSMFAVSTATPQAPLEIKIKSGTNTNILWVKDATNFLMVGTTNGIYGIRGDGGVIDASKPLVTSDRIEADQPSIFPPIDRLTGIVYTQKDGRKIRFSRYTFEKGGYFSTDVTWLGSHVTKSGVKQLLYQNAKNDTVWALKNDGNLIGAIISQEDQSIGWFRYETKGQILSVAISRRIDGYDDLVLLVKRDTENVFVETIGPDPEFPERNDFINLYDSEKKDQKAFDVALFKKQKEAVFLDSHKSFVAPLVNVDMNVTQENIGGFTGRTKASILSWVIPEGDRGKIFIDDSSNSGVGTYFYGENSGRARIIEIKLDVEGIPYQITYDVEEPWPEGEAITNVTFELAEIEAPEHLLGKKVKIIGDGAIFNEGVTFPHNSTVKSLKTEGITHAHIGINYDGLIKTNSIEARGKLGELRTISKSYIIFRNTFACQAGTNPYELDDVTLLTQENSANAPQALFTGALEVALPHNYARGQSVFIAQKNSGPCTVDAIVNWVNTGSG